MQTMINIFVADDHHIFRQGLIKLLESEGSIRILGESGDGAESLQLIRKLRPNIAILDISMPNLSGLDIIRQSKRDKLPVEFVILTMYDEEDYFNEAIDCGAKGYLLKENAISDLIQCVKCVAQGKHYLSPLISDYLLHRNHKLRQFKNDHPNLEKLTAMEKRILKLIAENKTSNEIAHQLFISPRTVENHRQHICDKLQLKGCHKLLQFALENKSHLE